MGTLPDFLPGYQSLDDDQSRRKFEDRWGCRLSDETGLTAQEVIERAKEGEIKGMYIVGENLALSFPRLTLVREALASLDFLVVQDMFLTETAQLAKVVLPAASFAEKEGTFTNFEGRVRRLRKALRPIGDSLPDWEIILRLANQMECLMAYSSPQEVMDEIQELVDWYQGAGYGDAEMKSKHLAEFGVSALTSRRLYKGKFPSGFGRFSPVEYVPQSDSSDDRYPLTLLAGSTLYHAGCGSRSSRSRRLKRFSPGAFVEISAPDAESLGVSDGDRVRIVSPVGEVTALARITGTVVQGVIFMPGSFPEAPVNTLLDITLDPLTKVPSQKTCLVRLERIENHG
jgi:predicted molibdopterin-dependent oxidoreductase YjgC